MTRTDARLEDLLRQVAPQVLGVLVRRYGHFDACEDAVQEALLAAATQWPADGLPDRPRAWLVTVASRRLTDELRSASARAAREQRLATSPAEAVDTESSPDDPPVGDSDVLPLLFLCCDPALSPASQMALTLRAIGGLSTVAIAAAFFVPEATMGQRISRAKQTIRERSLGQAAPDPGDPSRLAVVLHVLYLVFNEGYAASSGERLEQRELSTEAIRLTRLLHRLVPEDTEVAGLMALMLLTEARHRARVGPDGALVPLAEQDRAVWDRGLIEEGVGILMAALGRGRIGPYQLQASIAAAHDEATGVDDTDWVEIAGLYRLLERIDPSPVVTLNHAVAVAMVQGPEAGLAMVDAVARDSRLRDHHRVHLVRGHLLDLAGDVDGARQELGEAARRTTSVPERRHLERRVAALREGTSAGGGGAGGGAHGGADRGEGHDLGVES